MMKKNYVRPALQVVKVQQMYSILEGSSKLTGVNSNVGLTLSQTGSSQPGRSRDIDWDDEDY